MARKRKDPPLPQLAEPDPVTIHDLTPEERAKVEIVNTSGNYQWRRVKDLERVKPKRKR